MARGKRQQHLLERIQQKSARVMRTTAGRGVRSCGCLLHSACVTRDGARERGATRRRAQRCPDSEWPLPRCMGAVVHRSCVELEGRGVAHPAVMLLKPPLLLPNPVAGRFNLAVAAAKSPPPAGGVGDVGEEPVAAATGATTDPSVAASALASLGRPGASASVGSVARVLAVSA